MRTGYYPDLLNLIRDGLIKEGSFGLYLLKVARTGCHAKKQRTINTMTL